MKKVGIMCNNYKLEKFKELLTKKGFTNYKVTPHNIELSIITVIVRKKNVNKVHKICKQVEAHFKTNKN